MQYDFDIPVDRRGTGSYKWDSCPDAGVMPLWVADMDFRTAPAIIEALQQRVSHGVFGYVRVPDEYYGALCGWFWRKHQWRIDRRMVIYTSGVVPAVSAIIKALVRPGDGVMVQTPAYNCFFSSIRNNGCTVVENPLRRVECEGGFSYEMDFDDLEAKAARPENTLLILCNPHNPTGRVWTRAELSRVAGICHRHGVTVVSDEIHCELTMPGYDYVPYATVDSGAVVCCSPSKAFNIAGLQIANIVAPDEAVRARVDRAININEVCDVNPFGVVALMAAYDSGEDWLEALKAYLHGNWECLSRFFAENLPHLPVCRLQSTYLAWIDVSSLGMPSDRLEEKLLSQAHVWVNSGVMYGQEGYIRINFACPRRQLLEALQRMAPLLK